MNKLNRISAILVMLQSRRVITAQKIAEQFNISLRTVYRDIRVLEESGIPVVSNAGIGYSLVEGYKLPPLMFTTDEAIAFLMAEKIVSKQTDKNSYELYRSGMDKIRAVMRIAEKDILENIDNYIVITNHYTIPQHNISNILHPLIQSIINKNVVEINYHANYNQEVTKRDIEPLGLFYMSGAWYILAYCLLRKDYRTFKVNRIKEISSYEKSFSNKHDSLKSLIQKIYFNNETENHIVILKTNRTALKDISEIKFTYGLVNEEDNEGYIEQTYITSSLERFGRWFLSFADQAEIIQPQELKGIVKNLINNIKIT